MQKKNNKYVYLIAAVMLSWGISVARIIIDIHHPTVIDTPLVNLSDFNLNFVFAFLFL